MVTWKIQYELRDEAGQLAAQLVTSHTERPDATDEDNVIDVLAMVRTFMRDIGYTVEDENAQLRDALQSLYDVQNGSPLPKYQAEYDAAMAKARAALGCEPKRTYDDLDAADIANRKPLPHEYCYIKTRIYGREE
jgi:hypothetical protein